MPGKNGLYRNTRENKKKHAKPITQKVFYCPSHSFGDTLTNSSSFVQCGAPTQLCWFINPHEQVRFTLNPTVKYKWHTPLVVWPPSYKLVTITPHAVTLIPSDLSPIHQP